MKNYTVKEIAELLGINPETVRRWIRNGQLEAVQISRKGGNVISEESLKDFIKKTPQYAPLAAGLFATSPMSLAFAFGSVCTALIAAAFHKKEKKISPDEVQDYVKKELSHYERSAQTKRAQIKKLQQGLADDEKHIADYRYVLTHCDFVEMSNEINKNLRERRSK